MRSISRYMFRTTMAAFLITLVTLTVVMWFTQAIREFDLITTQRQTMFVFIGITGLLIPMLVMMIAPISLVLATAHVINKLSSDSEIIVMNAAGVSPWSLFRPFLAAGLIVAVLVAAIAVYISPWSLRELRDWITQVRADILTNIVQPGRFTTVGGNITFHIADRKPNGLLLGIFLDDRRNPKEHMTYLAEQGEIVKNDTWTFLVLEKGSIQRVESDQPDPRIVNFDRYAFDLSKFGGGQSGGSTYHGREKYIWELIWPPKDAPQSGEDRADLHDRIATPLYPIAFAILAYAFLGPPQTTRQSRTLSLLALIGVVALLRLVGFLSVILGARMPGALAVQYVALFGATAVGSWLIARGQAIEPAAAVSKIATSVGERLSKVTAS
jgi:lipopolysaccharide export system permease protein